MSGIRKGDRFSALILRNYGFTLNRDHKEMKGETVYEKTAADGTCHRVFIDIPSPIGSGHLVHQVSQKGKNALPARYRSTEELERALAGYGLRY
jgi:hypothetical protein